MISVGDIVRRADTQDAIQYFLRVGIRSEAIMQVLEVDRKTAPAQLKLLVYDMSTVEAYEDQVTKVETIIKVYGKEKKT